MKKRTYYELFFTTHPSPQNTAYGLVCTFIVAHCIKGGAKAMAEDAIEWKNDFPFCVVHPLQYNTTPTSRVQHTKDKPPKRGCVIE